MKFMKTIHAVYESGVFRPLETVELPERTEVEFEPRPFGQTQDHSGLLEGIYAILGEHDVAARHTAHGTCQMVALKMMSRRRSGVST
jgi:predicted DNA-binding antitoxin AbrB/MazE fold protein